MARLASRLGYSTLFFGGVAAYGLGASATYTYLTLGKSREGPAKPSGPCECSHEHVTQEQRLAAYAKRAKDYDRLIGRDEVFMGSESAKESRKKHAETRQTEAETYHAAGRGKQYRFSGGFYAGTLVGMCLRSALELQETLNTCCTTATGSQA